MFLKWLHIVFLYAITHLQEVRKYRVLWKVIFCTCQYMYKSPETESIMLRISPICWCIPWRLVVRLLTWKRIVLCHPCFYFRKLEGNTNPVFSDEFLLNTIQTIDCVNSVRLLMHSKKIVMRRKKYLRWHYYQIKIDTYYWKHVHFQINSTFS